MHDLFSVISLADLIIESDAITQKLLQEKMWVCLEGYSRATRDHLSCSLAIGSLASPGYGTTTPTL